MARRPGLRCRTAVRGSHHRDGTSERGEPNEPPPPVKIIPTKGLTIAEAQSHLSGRPGRSLYLNVHRPGTDRLLRFTVLHDKSEPETVFGVRRVQDDRWDHWLDRERKIGYVRVSAFTYNTYRAAMNEIAAIHIQGLKALVLDLRDNTGGYVQIATPVRSEER